MLDMMRRVLGRVLCCGGGGAGAGAIKPADAGIAARLQTWTVSTAKLHRIVRAMIVAEAATRSSRLHASFVRIVGEPLCELVHAVTTYHLAALAYSARIRLSPTAAAALTCCGCCDDAADGSGGGTTGDGEGVGCCGGGASNGGCCGACSSCCRGCGRVALHRTVAANSLCHGYPSEVIPTLADLLSQRGAVEAALTQFFRALQSARVQVLYDPVVVGVAAGEGAARWPASTRPEPPTGRRVDEGPPPASAGRDHAAPPPPLPLPVMGHDGHAGTVCIRGPHKSSITAARSASSHQSPRTAASIRRSPCPPRLTTTSDRWCSPE